MDDYNIIESEDEILEYDEEEQSILDILNSKEETYEESMEEVFNNLVLGEKLENKYLFSIKNKVPFKFVFKIDNELTSLVEKVQDKNLKIAYKIYGKSYNISINNFVLLYYISNKEMIPEDFIDQLNSIENLTNINYDYVLYDSYIKKFEESYKKQLENDKIDYEKIKTYYQSFDNLNNSYNYEDSYKTLELDKTCVKFIIKEENYILDIDFGSIMFDSIILNNNFIYTQYNSFDSNFYKTNTIEKNIDSILYLFNEQMTESNCIYLIYNLNTIKKNIPILITINLEQSTLKFTYPEATKKRILEDIKIIFPSIEYLEESVEKVTGKFEISINNFDDTRFYYLIQTDPVIGKVLFLNENTNPRSLQEKIKYYYKIYDKTRGSKKWVLFFYIERIFDNKYEIVFSSKNEEKDSIKEFMIILSKIFYRYNSLNLEESAYELISFPYNQGKGKGLGGAEMENVDSEKIFKNKKIDNLLIRAPKVFPRREYGRSCGCPKQPIIIDKEDVEDWENYVVKGKKRNVVLFPPMNSTQKGRKEYYVCPGENPVLSFIKNPDPKSEYPIIPCCTNVKSKDYLYKDYDKIRENSQEYFSNLEENKAKIGTYLKTLKILSNKQHGIVPEDLNIFLEKIYKNNNFLRMGVYQNSTSSFLHCLMLGSSHLKFLKIKDRDQEDKNNNIVQLRNQYIKETLPNKEKIIKAFRKNIFSFCNPEICCQENSQIEIGKIKEEVSNTLEIFSSEKYLRILEEIFKVNIFVFKEDPVSKNTILEKPNHVNYHIRNINHNLVNILIYKHSLQNVYELIRPASTSGKKTEGFLFTDKVSKQLEKNINKNGYYVYDEKEIRKNEYSYTNWATILKNYHIHNQSINSTGKTYMITIKKKEELISIFVPPSVPLNVCHSYDTYETTMETCISIFGKNYTKGSKGLWYEINGILSLFVPCKDVNKTTNFVCLEYLLNIEKNLLDKKLSEISIIRKNSLILKQLILWLWNLSPIKDVEEWFSKYTSITEKDRINQIFKNITINIDYKFPAFINTTEQGLEYLGGIMPYIFSSNSMFLYPELYNNLVQYIKNYNMSTEGLEKAPYKSIINIYNNETDFKKYPYNQVILGKNNFDDWLNNLEANKINPFLIEENMQRIRVIYPYIDKKKNMFFVQNTEDSMISVAIFSSLIWKLVNYNCGYNITMNNVWSVFLKYPELISYFNLDLIKLVKEKLDFNVEDNNEALEILLKELIAFDLKDNFKNYRIYSSSGVNNKYVKNRDHTHLWMYENGAFASMHPLL